MQRPPGRAHGGGVAARGMDPYKVPWFADCAPSLLTNRTIRRYLDAYSQHTWPEVIKLVLIYGILGLEQQFPSGPLSIPALRQLVERGGAGLVVDRTLPRLQRQILSLQDNLDAVFDRLAVEALPPPEASAAAPPPARLAGAGAVRPARQARQQQVLEVAPHPASRGSSASPSRPATALNPGPVAPKPPDAWRQGEPTGFPSPPRSRQQPLRRSQDNQGATNPIYPDWYWFAAPPEPQPAKRQAPAKPARRQPRLAYSVQQHRGEKAASPAADDLATAEYLVVPSSGYGADAGRLAAAQEEEPAGPDTMLTRVTPTGMTTAPVRAGAPLHAAPAAAAAAAAGGAPVGAAPRRGLQGVQSKIKASVEASRRHAAAQQQRRQLLLAAAVAPAAATGTAQQRQQQQLGGGGSRGAAAEAAAACASAAAADQFLANPWTAWFLGPPGAAAAAGGLLPPPQQQLASPAGNDEAGTAEGSQEGGPVAACMADSGVLVADVYEAAGALPAVLEADAETLEAVAEAAYGDVGQGAGTWQQQEQEGGASGRGVKLVAWSDTASPVGTAGAGGAGRPQRGVFADITGGLNQQQQHQQQPGGGQAAAGSSAAAAAQQQQQQQQPHRQAWAADFGHLENVPAAPKPQPAARGSRRGGRGHKKWSEQWVGDFGHLEDFPFGPASAFGHHQQQPGAGADSSAGEGAGTAAAAEPGSRLFMSPADLQQLVDAAGRLQAAQRDASAAGSSAAAGGAGGHEAAWEAAGAGQQALTGVEAAASPSRPPASAQAAAALPSLAAAQRAAGEGADAGGEGAGAAEEEEEASSVQALTARFTQLLARLDAQAAATDAADLPAGVAARAQAAVTAAPPPAPLAATGGAVLVESLISSSASASSSGGSSEDSFATGSSGGRAADALGALLGELAMAGGSGGGGAVAAAEDSAGARSEGGSAEAAAGDTDAYLSGLQDTGAMLQAALTRHDALMALIGSLQGRGERAGDAGGSAGHAGGSTGHAGGAAAAAAPARAAGA